MSMGLLKHTMLIFDAHFSYSCLLHAAAPKEPRLFQVSNVTGAIVVTEVPNFNQDDLLSEDVMVLDTFNQVRSR